VTLPADAAGASGGRLQELALAAAETLAARRAGHLTLLAGSTDGRDGPTDAAGAVVDAGTWDAIRAAGRDPAADLQAHRSHAALGAAGALLAGAPTGTNVADLVLALVMPTTHVPGND
jgi:hydroxypyruvate reductase